MVSNILAMKLVLVADDFDGVAEVTALLIESIARVRTLVALDGEEAVAIAIAERPDVVLLDIDMPRMNGIDAARNIRVSAIGGYVVLVAISGGINLLNAKASGLFNHVLQKPCDPERLVDLLGLPRI